MSSPESSESGDTPSKTTLNDFQDIDSAESNQGSESENEINAKKVSDGILDDNKISRERNGKCLIPMEVDDESDEPKDCESIVGDNGKLEEDKDDIESIDISENDDSDDSSSIKAVATIKIATIHKGNESSKVSLDDISDAEEGAKEEVDKNEEIVVKEPAKDIFVSTKEETSESKSKWRLVNGSTDSKSTIEKESSVVKEDGIVLNNPEAKENNEKIVDIKEKAIDGSEKIKDIKVESDVVVVDDGKTNDAQNKTNKDKTDDIKGKTVSIKKEPAPIETRRRSLRNASKKVEVVTPVVVKVARGEKRAAEGSPRGKEKIRASPGKADKKVDAKKGAETEVKSEEITPVKPKEKPVPKFEPMSDAILEEAKFPQFLKEVITLGCYVPILDQNTGHVKLKEGESLLEAPSLSMPLLLKKPDMISKGVVLKKDIKDETIKKNVFQNKPFFTSSIGEFLVGIGLSRVTEWYEKDMMKAKQRQIKREGQSVDIEDSLREHTSFFSRAKQANEPFNFDMRKCEFCDFKTESTLVMDGHLLKPHLTHRREFRCNFCPFIARDHKVILFHMEALHNKKGVLDLPGQFFYDCPFCTFETNLKTKVTSHINKCQKYFLSSRNQTPPGDFENPAVTAKPITLADIKSYEMCVVAANAAVARAGSKNMQRPGPGRPVSQTRIIRPAAPQYRTVTSQSNLSLYQQIVTASLKDAGHMGATMMQKNRFTSSAMKSLSGKPEITLAVPGGQIFQVVNNGQVVPVLNPSNMSSSGSQFMISGAQCSTSGQPQPVALFPNLATSSSSATISSSRNSMSIMPQSTSAAIKRLPSSTTLMPSIVSPANLAKLQQQQQSSLPKLQGPYTTVQTASKSGNGNPMLANTTFVICEICDGYLKDLEQLRTHMLWIHKVKIHPKMLSSRPPLNCQKCQWRFFTDQGLERHLLGAHGLVTSNMQELANKNQDGGRCTVCGRVYVCKLVSHMNQVHKATLKPAHLSYKCTVCSATFNLYKLFENHVYMFHSGSVKRSVADDSVTSAKKKLQISNSSMEMTVVPLKKNDNPPLKAVSSPAVSVTQPKAVLPPPMKLPAVEPLPPPITTNPTPEGESQLKKNFEFAKSGEKTDIKLINDKKGEKVECWDCGKRLRNIYMHMRVRHTRKCKVKLCRIEKCEKCLSSFDGMVVLHTADFEEESEDEKE